MNPSVDTRLTFRKLALLFEGWEGCPEPDSCLLYINSELLLKAYILIKKLRCIRQRFVELSENKEYDKKIKGHLSKIKNWGKIVENIRNRSLQDIECLRQQL